MGRGPRSAQNRRAHPPGHPKASRPGQWGKLRAVGCLAGCPCWAASPWAVMWVPIHGRWVGKVGVSEGSQSPGPDPSPALARGHLLRLTHTRSTVHQGPVRLRGPRLAESRGRLDRPSVHPRPSLGWSTADASLSRLPLLSAGLVLLSRRFPRDSPRPVHPSCLPSSFGEAFPSPERKPSRTCPRAGRFPTASVSNSSAIPRGHSVTVRRAANTNSWAGEVRRRWERMTSHICRGRKLSRTMSRRLNTPTSTKQTTRPGTSTASHAAHASR